MKTDFLRVESAKQGHYLIGLSLSLLSIVITMLNVR